MTFSLLVLCRHRGVFSLVENTRIYKNLAFLSQALIHFLNNLNQVVNIPMTCSTTTRVVLKLLLNRFSSKFRKPNGFIRLVLSGKGLSPTNTLSADKFRLSVCDHLSQFKMAKNASIQYRSIDAYFSVDELAI